MGIGLEMGIWRIAKFWINNKKSEIVNSIPKSRREFPWIPFGFLRDI
jgi:hypothetical protein